MLNTAVAQGFGLCGIDCDPDCKRLSPPIRQLLSMIAPTIEHVPESQMDALCAAGGAGLAFSYNFINALADGGVKIGLPRALALKLASKTALSSARTLLESGTHPSELREEVTAPGGAAAYGLHTLDRAEVASGVAAALEAAYLRNKELAE
jgi:pyrroline-5-carboxylate reductase